VHHLISEIKKIISAPAYTLGHCYITSINDHQYADKPPLAPHSRDLAHAPPHQAIVTPALSSADRSFAIKTCTLGRECKLAPKTQI